jgi:hypothetical protein
MSAWASMSAKAVALELFKPLFGWLDVPVADCRSAGSMLGSDNESDIAHIQET